MAIISNKFTGPARPEAVCARCKAAAIPGEKCFQIRNGDGVENPAFCSEQCAKETMRERGAKVRYCINCSKSIPRRLREQYGDRATLCSMDCAEDYQSLEGDPCAF